MHLENYFFPFLMWQMPPWQRVPWCRDRKKGHQRLACDNLGHFLVTLRKYTRETWWVGSTRPVSHSFPATEGSFEVCALRRVVLASRNSAERRWTAGCQTDKRLWPGRIKRRGWNTAEPLHKQSHCDCESDFLVSNGLSSPTVISHGIIRNGFLSVKYVHV